MKSRSPPKLDGDTLMLGSLRVPVQHNLLYVGAVAPKRIPTVQTAISPP